LCSILLTTAFILPLNTSGRRDPSQPGTRRRHPAGRHDAAVLAHVQAGCLLGDVDRETQIHGRHGAGIRFVDRRRRIDPRRRVRLPDTAVGLDLGQRASVLGFDVVTADGRLVRAGADENADLFWGLRGGGGNFGVVTGIDYQLYPVGPEIVGGVVAWPAREADQVLEFYRTFAEAAPPELTLVSLVRPAPPAPWLPKETHGKVIVAIVACHTGPVEEGGKAVAPIKSFGKPIGDVLVRRPYAQMQSLLDATQPKGRRYYWKSEYLSRIDPALCDKAIAHAEAIRSPHSAVILFQMRAGAHPGRARCRPAAARRPQGRVGEHVPDEPQHRAGSCRVMPGGAKNRRQTTIARRLGDRQNPGAASCVINYSCPAIVLRRVAQHLRDK
jgi:hypothetical protein